MSLNISAALLPSIAVPSTLRKSSSATLAFAFSTLVLLIPNVNADCLPSNCVWIALETPAT